MASYTIDTSAPVLVTGATGYVAGWIVKNLLDAGVSVHAAVRDPENKKKIGHLTQMAAGSPGNLQLFATDLLKVGSYAEAMQDCAILFHTASPFTTSAADPQKELIEPAKIGTRNVLEEAERSETVRRVVLTSSCAAIYTDAADCVAAPGGMITEAIWNSTASLDYQPYSYSKTVAEREAWEISGRQSRWRLVVVNPCLVIGPATNANPTSESFNLLKQLGDGRMKSGAPRIGVGVVDVRDVAQAHIAAAYSPDAEGRNIICAKGTNPLELAQALHSKYGADYPLPKCALPKWLVWMAAPFIGLDRKFVSRNVDIPWRADNSKAVRKLGMTYRPIEESIQEMFQQMIDRGYFRKS